MTVDVFGTAFRFADPWLLALLVAIPIGLALRAWRERRPGGALLFSSLGLLPGRQRSWRVRIRPLLLTLRVVSLVLLIAALARPQTIRASELAAEGIDIAIVLDVSGSMAEAGFGGTTKIEAVKKVVIDFFQGLKNDRVGLVIFAGEGLLLAPLTLDHPAVQRLVEPLETGRLVSGGTAIGMGLANGLNVLRASAAKSKVAIVLTDGQNNSGQITPLDAAEAARLLGIRVHTIGAIRRSELGTGTIPVDEQLMRQMSDMTGGRYFRALDEDALRQIYDDIAKLERSRLGIRAEFAAYEDAMLPLLLVGTVLLLLELLLATTILRRAP